MDLPFEIWLHIASFIPTSQLRRLYTVNHIFHAIATAEKYKEIYFCKEPRYIAGFLSCLMQSSSAQHVRTLNLYPDILADYLARKPKSRRGPKTTISMPTRLYKYTGIPITEHDRWAAKVKTQMLQLVGSMSDMVDFSMATRGHYFRSQFREQIVNAG